MIGALVSLAATRSGGAGRDLQHVQAIVGALEPTLGWMPAAIMVSLGFFGGALCAAFVVSLAASWAVCEAMNWNEVFSLDEPPSKAPHFYCCFLCVVLIGALALLTGVSVVQMNILVELMNGVLMPFTVGFLFLLSTGEALPLEARVMGWHKTALAVAFAVCAALALGTAVYSLAAGLSTSRR